MNELTIESALAELREMFPTLTVVSVAFADNCAAKEVRICAGAWTVVCAETLSEAMQQVRERAKQQSKGG